MGLNLIFWLLFNQAFLIVNSQYKQSYGAKQTYNRRKYPIYRMSSRYNKNKSQYRKNYLSSRYQKSQTKKISNTNRKRYRKNMNVDFDNLVYKQIQVVGKIPSFNELFFKDSEKIQNFRSSKTQHKVKGRRLYETQKDQQSITFDMKDMLSEIQIDSQYIKEYQKILMQSNLKQDLDQVKKSRNELLLQLKIGFFQNSLGILSKNNKNDKRSRRRKPKNSRMNREERKKNQQIYQKNMELVKDLPKQISWQQYVIRVEDQGDCSSCYSFSVTSAIEILWNAKKNEKIELSDQEIVDCDTHNDGCNGGSALGVLEYIKTQGISFREDYLYKGKQETCQRKTDSKKFKQTFQYFGIFDKIQLLKSLQYGPVVVFHHTDDDFKDYQGGVIDTNGCHGKLNHSGVVIGYDLTATEPYILLMNNWGDYDWGEKGFYKMKLGDLSDKSDMCNMFGHFSNILIKIDQLIYLCIFYKWNLQLVEDKKEKYKRRLIKCNNKVILIL